jgi:hypothetical protein
MQALEMHLLLVNIGGSGTVVRKGGESTCSFLGRMARIAPDGGMVVQPGFLWKECEFLECLRSVAKMDD